MSIRGRFIVVEGLEGAGKSTAIHTIQNYLMGRVPEILSTREPGGTEVGEATRQLIKGSKAVAPLDPRSELLLLYASRVQLIEQVIKPALARGCWVIADRFELSTWAYQGWGRKLDHQMIVNLSAFCLQGFKPDLTIFLDISPEQGLMRAHKRGQPDRIEQESLDFFKKVYQGYHHQLRQINPVKIIDASKPYHIVQKLICSALSNYLHSSVS